MTSDRAETTPGGRWVFPVPQLPELYDMLTDKFAAVANLYAAEDRFMKFVQEGLTNMVNLVLPLTTQTASLGFCFVAFLYCRRYRRSAVSYQFTACLTRLFRRIFVA